MGNLSVTFKALSDPTRRQILKLLQAGDLTAGEIAEQFSISKPSISHHLNLLKQAGLVLDLRHGQHIVYSLNTSVFQDAVAWLMDLGTGLPDGPAGPSGNEAGDSSATHPTSDP